MNEGESGELRSLLAKALDLCHELQRYTDENFDVFISDDDEKIIEVVNRREKIIDALAVIEGRIDSLLFGAEEPVADGALPPEAAEIRRSVRSALADISVKDTEIMKILSGSIQKYKTDTLQARSKRHISAYIRSSTASFQEPGDSINLLN